MKMSRAALESVTAPRANDIITGPTATAAAQETASSVRTVQALQAKHWLEATLEFDATTAVSVPTLALTSTETPQPTYTPTCPTVTGPFTEVWQSVHEAIGCASSQVIVGLAAEENFGDGKMLWREPIDHAQALVLFKDRTWQIVEHEPYDEDKPEFSCPDADTPSECPPTPKRGFGMIWCERPQIRSRLGDAIDCERSYQGSIQQFDQGSMLLNDNGAIYVLYGDGYWEQYLSGPFAGTWSDVQNTIGCATEPHFITWVAEEAFQNGRMYWRKDNDRIYVVYDWGNWEIYSHTWREGDPYYSCVDEDTPEESPPTPVMGFGQVWCIHPDVRQNLGWATEAEHGYDANIQHFEQGFMMRTDKWTWVFYANGLWKRW